MTRVTIVQLAFSNASRDPRDLHDLRDSKELRDPRDPKHTFKSPSSYTIQMELRDGDLAGNKNIWSYRRAALYSLIFQSVLPGG